MTAAFAGQLVVAAILGVAVGSAVVLGLIKIYVQYQEMKERHERRTELRLRATAPFDPNLPLLTYDDDLEDSEHMRVVREHRATGANE